MVPRPISAAIIHRRGAPIEPGLRVCTYHRNVRQTVNPDKPKQPFQEHCKAVYTGSIPVVALKSTWKSAVLGCSEAQSTVCLSRLSPKAVYAGAKKMTEFQGFLRLPRVQRMGQAPKGRYVQVRKRSGRRVQIGLQSHLPPFAVRLRSASPRLTHVPLGPGGGFAAKASRAYLKKVTRRRLGTREGRLASGPTALLGV
jgi:hypothetical protein